MRACALVQAVPTPDPAPDTGKEEKGTPGYLRRRWWVGQVRIDDQSPNGGRSMLLVSPPYIHFQQPWRPSRAWGMDHAKAVKHRDIFAQLMTPAQIAEAQRLAREWKPKK